MGEIVYSAVGSTCCGDQSNGSARWVGNGVYMSTQRPTHTDDQQGRDGAMVISHDAKPRQRTKPSNPRASCILESGVSGQAAKAA